MTMLSVNLISHVRKTRKFIMAILHGKQGLLCDKVLCYVVGVTHKERVMGQSE